MSAAVIVAPTDAQLACIIDMCDERGIVRPAVYSKLHASEIIEAIRSRTYDPLEHMPALYGDPEDVPF